MAPSSQFIKELLENRPFVQAGVPAQLVQSHSVQVMGALAGGARGDIGLYQPATELRYPILQHGLKPRIATTSITWVSRFRVPAIQIWSHGYWLPFLGGKRSLQHLMISPTPFKIPVQTGKPKQREVRDAFILSNPACQNSSATLQI